jgi:predicted transcriptional regulator
VKNTSKSHKSRKTEKKAPSPKVDATAKPSRSELPGALVAIPPTGDPAATSQLSPVILPLPEAQEPKKQGWYRPPDSKARKLVDKIVVHREAGRSDAEIAKILKTTEASVRQYVYIAKKNGWLDDEGAPVDLEAELALNIDAKVVRNIAASLDGHMTNYQTHEMTLAAAKGRGMFKSSEAAATSAASLPVVAIQVIMPTIGAGDQMQMQQIAEDQMGGVPAYIDGEVAEPKLLEA